MHTPVMADLPEIGKRRKVIFFCMFQDKYPLGLEQILFENDPRKRIDSRQIVRRIGEDEIELFAAGRQKGKHVCPERKQLLCTQRLFCLADKTPVKVVLFHTDHPRATSGYKLQRDTSRTGEKIECDSLFPVYPVVEDIEKPLLREICRRSRFQAGWYLYSPGFVFSADYTHRAASISVGSNLFCSPVRMTPGFNSKLSTWRISFFKISVTVFCESRSPDRHNVSVV